MSDFDPDGLFSTPSVQEPKYYSKTQKALHLLQTHDISPKDALTLARGSVPSRDAVTKFKQKAARYSLTRPAMVKLAHNVVKDTLIGQVQSYTTEKIGKNGQVVTIVETIAPTVTNQLAAAAMVFDRAEPVVRQNVNLNGDIKDFMPVNLGSYE